MVRLVLNRLNRKWLAAVALFSIGLLTPYCLHGFFQALSAQETAAAMGYPADLKKRFADAVSLTDEKRYDEAIVVYREIIARYPQYPEPYNNLAVIYADRRQFDLAQEQLEKAIDTSAAYGAVYRNLSGVYEKMASESYRRALHLDKPTTETPAKLTQIVSLNSSPTTAMAARLVTLAEETADSRPTASKPETTALNVGDRAASSTTAQAPTPVLPKAETNRPVLPTPPVPVVETAVVAKPVVTPKIEPKAEVGKTPVVKAIEQWASAWSDRDVSAYFAAYSSDFKTPNGQPRSQWEKERRARIVEKPSISVSVDNIDVDFLNDTQVKARFTQRYEAGSLKSRTKKTMILKRVGSNWKIQEERIGS